VMAQEQIQEQTSKYTQEEYAKGAAWCLLHCKGAEKSVITGIMSVTVCPSCPCEYQVDCAGGSDCPDAITAYVLKQEAALLASVQSDLCGILSRHLDDFPTALLAELAQYKITGSTPGETSTEPTTNDTKGL
jgi:hypothetical protein